MSQHQLKKSPVQEFVRKTRRHALGHRCYFLGNAAVLTVEVYCRRFTSRSLAIPCRTTSSRDLRAYVGCLLYHPLGFFRRVTSTRIVRSPSQGIGVGSRHAGDSSSTGARLNRGTFTTTSFSVSFVHPGWSRNVSHTRRTSAVSYPPSCEPSHRYAALPTTLSATSKSTLIRTELESASTWKNAA